MFRRLAWPVWLLFFSCQVNTAIADQHWETDFIDDFHSFDSQNWQDQILWVNNEDQCYVRDGAFGTREVSDGTLKLRVIDLGKAVECDNPDKAGNIHPPTQYVAGRLTTKNRKEFTKGRWTARLRLNGDGQDGMFPAWWLLGARNNEPPIEQPDENICWPMPGSGEIDIFEHYGSNGQGHYTARKIRHLGHCRGGDWSSEMKDLHTSLGEYHEYSVEWDGQDLLFALDGKPTFRLPGAATEIQEPLFAVLNYAKINQAPMRGTWEMEIDWVKHERLVNR